MVNFRNEWSGLKWPETSEILKTKYYYQVEALLNYNLGRMGSLNLNFSNFLDRPPLYKLNKGYTLRDFQTLIIPTESIKPTMSKIRTITYSLGTPISFLNLDIAFLKGYTQNLDQPTFDKITILKSAQLDSDFTLFSINLKSNSTASFPVEFKLIPELIHQNSNYLNNEKTNFSTFRTALGSNTKFIKNFNLALTTQYNQMSFRGGILNQRFIFINNDLNAKYKLLKGSLLLDGKFRMVIFNKTEVKPYNQLDFKAIFNRRKYQLYLNSYNLLNSKHFLTQDLNDNIFSEERNETPGRSVWLAFILNSNNRFMVINLPPFLNQ